MLSKIWIWTLSLPLTQDKWLNLWACLYKLVVKGVLSQVMLILMPLGTNKCSDFTAMSLILVEFTLTGEGWHLKFASVFVFFYFIRAGEYISMCWFTNLVSCYEWYSLPLLSIGSYYMLQNSRFIFLHLWAVSWQTIFSNFFGELSCWKCLPLEVSYT